MFILLFPGCACPDRIGAAMRQSQQKGKRQTIGLRYRQYFGIGRPKSCAGRSVRRTVPLHSCRLGDAQRLQPLHLACDVCGRPHGQSVIRTYLRAWTEGWQRSNFRFKFDAQIRTGQRGGHETTGRWYRQYLSISVHSPEANSALRIDKYRRWLT